MKKLCLLLAMTLAVGLTGCHKSEADTKTETKQETSAAVDETVEDVIAETDVVKIELSNSEILVDGEKISEDTESAVYKANDIIFYLEDQGIAYGEGTEKDAHSQIEADAHTVVHIAEPGTYEISGTMDAGQIFVDLGDGTKDEEEAVATLILNNADITCTVAPAILFYRTYECAGDVEEEDATMDVDTTAAGANLVLADGSKNKVYGSYVAEIYESCELNEEGTEEEGSGRSEAGRRILEEQGQAPMAGERLYSRKVRQAVPPCVQEPAVACKQWCRHSSGERRGCKGRVRRSCEAGVRHAGI